MLKKLMRLILSLCLWCSVTTSAPQTTMTAGWNEIANTLIRPVCWNGGNCAPVVYAWGGGILDTLRNRIIIWGGGHGDYGGNEQYAVSLNGTPAAALIAPNTNPSACSMPSCDGGVTPNSRHTYDQITYMANYDALFAYSGSLAGNGFGQQDAWMYLYGTGQWQYLNPISTGQLPVSMTNTGFVEYDPVTGKVFVWDGRSLFHYDYSTKAWTTRFFSENGYVSPYSVGTIDPVRRRLWAVGVGTGKLLWFDISDPPVADPRNTLTPTGATSVLTDIPNPGIAYDPVSTHLIMWGGGDTVYDYNPDTNVITAITGYSGGPGAQPAAGTFSGRWQYSPQLDGFTLINSVDQNAFVFRTRGDAPPPPPPTSDVLTVGPGKQFATISEAITACTSCTGIDIDAGIYPNESATITRNITMRGVGGYAHLKWGTGDAFTNTANIPNGKAMLIINADVTLENVEFSGAKVADENGAGIRYEGGNLTIRGSYFHHNENGLLGQGGLTNTLTVENSIFDRNGFCGGGGCAHNIYVGTMGRLIFRHNKSVDSRDGSHTLKSRALVNEVYGNFLSTKNSDGSYEADFPNGGTLYFVGNVVEQGANTSNSTVLGYGLEGSSNPSPKLFVINNTFNNLRNAGATFVQVNGKPELSIKNNAFTGGGTLLVGASTDLSSNKELDSADFANASTGDYHLVSGSVAVDAGVDPGADGTYSLAPQWEYIEPAEKVARAIVGAALEIGAYESVVTQPVTGNLGVSAILGNSGVYTGNYILLNGPFVLDQPVKATAFQMYTSHTGQLTMGLYNAQDGTLVLQTDGGSPTGSGMGWKVKSANNETIPAGSYYIAAWAPISLMDIRYEVVTDQGRYAPLTYSPGNLPAAYPISFTVLNQRFSAFLEFTVDAPTPPPPEPEPCAAFVPTVSEWPSTTVNGIRVETERIKLTELSSGCSATITKP